jgi:branched-chain amino acid transport system permease protein
MSTVTAVAEKPRRRRIAMRDRWANLPRGVRWLFLAALVVFVYVLPFPGFYEYLGFPVGSKYIPLFTTASDFATVLFDVSWFVLLAVGLNVVVGFAGLLDLGYFGFFAVGAYTVAMLSSPESRLNLDSPWPWVACVPAAIAITMLAGTILGWPTLRLRGDYLAIVTLGFAEMIRIFASNQDLPLNGQRGISAIPHPPGTGADGKPLFGVIDPKPYYWLAVTIVIVAIFLVRNLERSRVGRAWVAIREDEDAAEIMGVHTFRFKLWAFAIGAAVGGLSGALYAGKLSFINSDSFTLENSILVLAAVILGGAGNIPGAIIGGIVVWYMPEWLRTLGAQLGFTTFNPAEYRFLVFGIVLIVMMIFRPQGIWPSRRVAAEVRDRRREAVPQEAATP